jgi:GT2 family glycosyltransferase
MNAPSPSRKTSKPKVAPKTAEAKPAARKTAKAGAAADEPVKAVPEVKAAPARKSRKAAVADVSAVPAGPATPVSAPIPVAPIVNPLEAELGNLRAENANLRTSVARLESHVHHLNTSLIAYSRYTNGLAQATSPLKAYVGRRSRLGDMGRLIALMAAKGPARGLRDWAAATFLRDQGLFDQSFYASQLTEKVPQDDLLWHYVSKGYEKGLSPSEKFDTAKYLEFYPDIKAARAEPYSHYIRFGQNEHRVALPVRREMPDVFVDSVARPFGSGQVAAVAAAAARPIAARAIDPEARLRYRWIMAETPDRDRGTLGLYDVRADDDVPVEGAAGEAFLKAHGLLSDTPDFAGAVAALNALAPKGRIVTTEDQPVDVSIVIPVYGQLAYTLNCLHSLIPHESRFSFEIIVGDDQSPDDSGEWLPQVRAVRYLRQETNGGFILNCNRSAELARGRFIVMLNNDTRVVANWLDEMVGSFDVFPSAGLVGSKLHYPDGSLQEAGGIIWQDGSAWNYGRNDDPNRPRYCYAREVDYISGCSLALPTELWRKLGGFDTHFKPAYCEDSDLCFRVRDLGLETWYQPLSRVIHYEGKTSGTDLTQGVKAYQVTNSKKLYERWKHVIETHRPNAQQPWLERDRKRTKRAVVVDATNPAPWMDAGSVTTVTTARLYQQLGYKVTFIPQDNFLYQAREVRNLQRIGVECLYAPYYVKVAHFLQEQGGLFDICQVFRVGVAEKIVDDIREYAPDMKIAFHTSDLHFLRLEREAALSNDPKAKTRAEETRRRELGLIAKVDCTVTHSPVEAEIITEALEDAPVVVFPYLTDYVGTKVDFEARKDIMFLGGYGHPPNADAVDYFVREVWPLLADRLPDAKYLIVGSKPTEAVKKLAGDRVIVTGMVEDLQPWFDRSRVFAATIRYGAGVKGKVSTSMAHGVPVVATACAAEGMFLVDGESVLIADDAKAIADAIYDLYTDESAWARMSDESLRFVKVYNSFDMGLKTVEEVVRKATLKHEGAFVQDFNFKPVM